MFKRILSGLLAAFIASAAFAVDVKISAEPAMSALAGAEIFLGNQGGVTKTATGAQIATYVNGNLSSIALASLAAQATNTIVGNATSGSAAPTALAIGSCSGASNALIWTTNTGFGCNTFNNGFTVTGNTVSLNASSNFAVNIGTGTSTGTVTLGQNSATPGSVVLNGPVTFGAGTAFSGASWATTSPVWNGATLTLNDTTASGTITTEVARSLQAPNFTSTGGASTTITNAVNLYVDVPTCSGGVVCSGLYSAYFNGLIKAVAGATLNGGTVGINASTNNTTNINTGTSNATVTLGGTTAGNKTNFASINTQFGAVLYASVTAPTINSHFNTSGDSIVASSTASFQITVGTGTGTSTGSVTMPAATTGWACSVGDVTTPASHNIEQTGSTTTSVTVTDFSRTLGTAQNFVNSDKIEFLCGAN